jgi:hypothetical protein
MIDLVILAQRQGFSAERLRFFAEENCHVPANTSVAQLDRWLFDRLSRAAELWGALYRVENDFDALEMLNSSIMFESGSFAENCRALWQEFEKVAETAH